jgi:hypothetical protein
MPSDSLSTWDDNPPVVMGTHVLLELIDEHGARERYEFDMTPDSASDFDAGLLGLGTPLGKAISGKKAGTTVAYVRGDLRSVEILTVLPPAGALSTEAAERRRQALEEARRKVAKTAAQTFAQTFEGKWGGYDPDGMEHWDDANNSLTPP